LTKKGKRPVNDFRLYPTSISTTPQIQNEKSGTIDIDLGHARVRIEGPVGPDCVRAALEGLIR